MLELDGITDLETRAVLQKAFEDQGREALRMAQRAVGRPETGGLTQQDVELINASDQSNFRRRWDNITVAHKNPTLKIGAPKVAKAKENENAIHVPLANG